VFNEMASAWSLAHPDSKKRVATDATGELASGYHRLTKYLQNPLFSIA